MRQFFKALDARDIHFYLGAALIASGLYFVYPPSALIVPGCLFTYISMRRPSTHGHPEQH